MVLTFLIGLMILANWPNNEKGHWVYQGELMTGVSHKAELGDWDVFNKFALIL